MHDDYEHYKVKESFGYFSILFALVVLTFVGWLTKTLYYAPNKGVIEIIDVKILANGECPLYAYGFMKCPVDEDGNI